MLAAYKAIDSKILLSQIRSGIITDADVKDYLVDLAEQIEKRPDEFHLIIDVSESQKLSSEQRIMMGAFIKKNQQLLLEKVITLIYVVPTPLLQFVLNGIFLFKKPPIPYKVFNRLNEAINWAQQ